MDSTTAARRVKALRALSVDPGATDSERARAKEAADRIAEKYKVTSEPQTLRGASYQRVTYEDYLRSVFTDAPLHSSYIGPTGRGKSYLYVVSNEDLDDIVEDGYLYDPEDYDED